MQNPHQNNVENYLKSNLSKVLKNIKVKKRIAQAATVQNCRINLNNWARENSRQVTSPGVHRTL
jgi:hypothetical protein